MKDPKLILITGESGSGKTTIAKALKETLTNKEVFLIEMENILFHITKEKALFVIVIILLYLFISIK